ncbi:MAG: hypothetical protein Q9169_006266 [Polycauliona sp. 2 TL-2023]
MSRYLSQDSFAKDMSNVKGLYVGMNLLNQLEPLEQHHSRQHDKNIDSMSIDEQSLLAVETDSPKMMPSDTSSETSIWKDVRREFFELTGEVLSQPPSFQKYLQQLKPSVSGQVCCPACRQYKHDQFSLDCIPSHFRFHHLDPDTKFIDQFEGKPRIDHLIRQLMKRPEADAIRLDLYHMCDAQARQYRLQQQTALESALQAETYNKAKLPSICLAIFRLVVCCDGQLLCRHKACKGRTRFNASVEDIESHFTEVHCAHLTANMSAIDKSRFQRDLQEEFSPDRIAWMLDPLLAEADKRTSEWEVSSPREKRKAEDLDQTKIKQMHSIHDYVRKRRQWTVLQELRTEFASRNQHLVRLISESNSVELKLLGEYDPTDLLDTGILTFKDILSGTSSNSLKEVLAFLHLSYSAAIVMRRRGTPSSFSPSAGDLSFWRYSVPEQQRSMFDKIIHLMYPDLRDRYDYHVTMEPVHPGEAADHVHGFATDMLHDFEQHQDFDFSCFDDTFLQFVNAEGGQPKNDSSTDDPLGTLTLAFNQASSDHRPSHPADTDIPTFTTQYQLLSFVERLRETEVFGVVMHFVTYVSQLGFLLWTLGNSIDGRSPDHSSSATSSSARAGFSRFAVVLRSQVVGPLSLDPDLSELRPFVTVLVKMIELGWLLSLRAFEDCIITIVQHFPVSRHVFGSLVEKTLTCCSTAARTLHPGYIGSTDSDSFDEYDSIHVRPRQEQHLNAFLTGNHGRKSFEKGSQSSDETLTDDIDSKTTTNNMPSPVAVDIDFDTFIQNLGMASSSTFPSFDSAPIPDLPDISTFFHEPTTLNTPSTIHPTTPTTPPAKQYKSCTVPGCSNVFTGVESTNNLRRHKREKHSNRSSWSCPFENCDLVSSRLHNIRQHWLKKHYGAPMPEELMPRRAKGGGGLSRRVTAVLPIV